MSLLVVRRLFTPRSQSRWGLCGSARPPRETVRTNPLELPPTLRATDTVRTTSCQQQKASLTGTLAPGSGALVEWCGPPPGPAPDSDLQRHPPGGAGDGADLTRGGQPDRDDRERAAGDRAPPGERVAAGRVVDDAGEPRTGGAAGDGGEHQGAEDRSVVTAFEDLRGDGAD